MTLKKQAEEREEKGHEREGWADEQCLGDARFLPSLHLSLYFSLTLFDSRSLPRFPQRLTRPWV